MASQKRVRQISIVVIIVVILGVLALAVTTTHKNDAEMPNSGNVRPSDEKPAAKYKDGSYNATGTYFTPSSKESVEVNVTLSGDTISNVSLVQHPTSPQAIEFQRVFADNYKPLVAGKNIDDISLSRVAGSSLTSSGFNKALEKIKSDASL